jgi:hypothetical protein
VWELEAAVRDVIVCLAFNISLGFRVLLGFPTLNSVICTHATCQRPAALD